MNSGPLIWTGIFIFFMLVIIGLVIFFTRRRRSSTDQAPVGQPHKPATVRNVEARRHDSATAQATSEVPKPEHTAERLQESGADRAQKDNLKTEPADPGATPRGRHRGEAAGTPHDRPNDPT